MFSAYPTDIALYIGPGLPTTGSGNRTSPDQSTGNTIQPDLNITTTGGAGYSGLEACRTVAKIDIAVNSIIPILNIPDILSTFGTVFGLDSLLVLETFRFNLCKGRYRVWVWGGLIRKTCCARHLGKIPQTWLPHAPIMAPTREKPFRVSNIIGLAIISYPIVIGYKSI